jgi:hypothetical protein
MKGGKREGAGRPPGTTSIRPVRDVVKQVRWTAEEWQMVEEEARQDGRSPSEFIRRVTLSRCEAL